MFAISVVVEQDMAPGFTVIADQLADPEPPCSGAGGVHERSLV